MMLPVLAKMIACSGILMGYYWLFLRNKKFHHYNRFYLLAVTAASMVLPFLRIPVLVDNGRVPDDLVGRSIEIISASRWEEDFVDESQLTNIAQWLSVDNLLMLSYSLIVVIMIISLTRSLNYIRRLSRKYSFERVHTLRLYKTSEPGTPFSFFKSIFWNSRVDINSKEGQQIFRHELFHVRQKHSADVIFLELVCIVFWINPLFHLIKKEIKAIHEFLADQHAIEQDSRNEYAEMLILQTLLAKQSSISNYFFQNHIKRRIAMITQLKSKKYSYWTRLFVLPLSVCLFCAIALYAKTPGKPGGLTTIHKNSVVKTVVPLTVLVDAGHGGEDAGARTSTGLLEKDLCLAIAKQVQQQAAGYDLKIIMTRENDVYPTLRQRTELAAAVKADLIISLHVASSETGNEESGFDIFVTNKNEQLLPRSKQLGSDISDQLKSLYSVGPLKQRKEKGIWILDAAPCPAVLIECGYLTSEKDLAFISNPENQQKIARTILNGVTKYQARNLADAQTQTPLLIASLADTAKPQQNQDELRRKEEQLKQAEAKILELEARQKALEQKHRELEEQNKKMAEARMLDLEAKQKALEQKQRDREQQHKKLAEAKMRDIESRQKALDQKNQQMEKENQKRLEEDRKKFESKQKEFESKRRKMDADNEQLSRKAALDHELQKKVFTQKQHEMQLAQKLSADDRLAKVQMAQKALALQKKDMEIQQRKMLEVKRMELKHQEKAIKQHQQELEQANRKMEELKRKEINIQKKMKQAETKETREKESEE